jgi:hypothetical protein
MATTNRSTATLTKEQAEEVIRFLEEKRVWGRVIKIIIGIIVGGCGLMTYLGVTRSFWISMIKEIIK